MRLELDTFQKTAVYNLRMFSEEAINTYSRLHIPQIISFTAPTGAGKTIIMASLMEHIFFGDDFYTEQPDAIFVWLSDSPQLNEQSKNKIDTQSDMIRLGQCVTISEESFDQEMLDDGKIYFLNTQKLSAGKRLIKKGDKRTYTIWETFANTVADKSDRLYFIIDEAHRGTSGRDAQEAASIMQKFIKGSREDGLPPMPVVIGMSATMKRFNALVSGLTRTIYPYSVSTKDVRDSGLLKDRIVITYPESGTNNEMAVLQAAADDWKTKCDHWQVYCKEEHEANVNPIFVIQVASGRAGKLSETDLDEALKRIEGRTGYRFTAGQVAHTFGETHASLTINGLEVRYVEPSDIADDKNIRVVFFKENLSTGWDCPRAETMMSFCHRQDYTYIAQLLGRMVRTPLHYRIKVDEVLNDVHLFLPYFDKDTVRQVIDALQDSEDGGIASDVYGEELGDPAYEALGTNPAVKRVPDSVSGSTNMYSRQTDAKPKSAEPVPQNFKDIPYDNNDTPYDPDDYEYPDFMTREVCDYNVDDVPDSVGETETVPDLFDRDEVMRFINNAGILTYHVRPMRRSGSYLHSLFNLTHLLSQSGLYAAAVNDVDNDIVAMIHDYIEGLKSDGTYDDKIREATKFELQTRTVEIYGESAAGDAIHDIVTSTDADIDRQYRLAENKLCDDGIGNAYGREYGDWNDPDAYELDVILFANDPDAMKGLNDYAKEKFHELNDTYRRRFKMDVPEKYRNRYEEIVKDGDAVAELNFTLPEKIQMRHDDDGREYPDHLFVNEGTGVATIKLNNWETGVLDEERARGDFVCWIRNPSDKSWSLTIPYEYNGETKSFHPDFLIIRKDGAGYIMDILDPHRPDLKDNVPKAKGLAEYAYKDNPYVGRIQLIRAGKDPTEKDAYIRLDMSKSAVRDKVRRISTDEELNTLFQDYGVFG